VESSTSGTSFMCPGRDTAVISVFPCRSQSTWGEKLCMQKLGPSA